MPGTQEHGHALQQRAAVQVVWSLDIHQLENGSCSIGDARVGFGDRVMVINFGSAARRNESYANKRAEMYGELKKWLTDEQMPPSIPDDNALHADLTAASYSYDSKTRLKLEKKAEIKKRFLRSPDGADALALTFAFPIGATKKTKAIPIPTKSYF